MITLSICLSFIFTTCNQLNMHCETFAPSAHYKTITPIAVNNDNGLKSADTTIIVLKKLKYALLDIKDYKTGKRQLLIQKDHVTQGKIFFLTPDIAQGFSVNWIKETSVGFEISIEYGSRFYVQKNFQFIYENNSFYLKNIITSSFDKYSPEKYEKTIKKLKKPFKVTNFKMEDFV